MECEKSDSLLIVQCQNNEEVEYLNNLHKGLVNMLANRVVVLPKGVSLIAVSRDIQVVYQV